MDIVEKKPTSWLMVAAAYAGIVLAFALGRLVLVSSARDPYIWNIEIPRTEVFRICCGLAAFLSGIAGLFAIGIVADRGTSRQLMVGMMALPLVLILLEIMNMEY